MKSTKIHEINSYKKCDEKIILNRRNKIQKTQYIYALDYPLVFNICNDKSFIFSKMLDREK